MDPFDVLGIEPTFDLGIELLEQRYRDLQRVLHPDRHVSEPPGVRRESLGRAVSVNEAFRVLRDELGRATAVLARLGVEVDEARQQPADPMFLMQVMELREGLEEARTSSDMDRVQALRDRVEVDLSGVRAGLRSGFATLLSGGGESGLLEEMTDGVARLRYFHRFLEQVSDMEERILA